MTDAPSYDRTETFQTMSPQGQCVMDALKGFAANAMNQAADPSRTPMENAQSRMTALFDARKKAEASCAPK